jgi:hypothetical protein
VEVASEAGAIEQAELQIRVRGDSTATILPATLLPGKGIVARAEWATRRSGIPPGAPFAFQWKVRDEAGNIFQSPEQESMTLDPSRSWSQLADDRVGVWWFEGGPAFGQQIFDLASDSLRQMEAESGLELPFRLHVVLYPDSASFAAWHDYVLDWVAGEAYPGMGLTVQVVSPSDPREWFAAVICHEVAHLYFRQATYNALSSGPTTWINEGYAQHHECVPPIWQSQVMEQAMDQGELIPLRLATGSFSGDDDRINLLYAESWSAVDFLYDRWGEEGMAKLLAAFRSGDDSEAALLSVTGLDFEQFQQAWWEWLGGVPGAYPTPPVLRAATLGPQPAATTTPAPAVLDTEEPDGVSAAQASKPGPGCPSGILAGMITLALALVPVTRKISKPWRSV